MVDSGSMHSNSKSTNLEFPWKGASGGDELVFVTTKRSHVGETRDNDREFLGIAIGADDRRLMNCRIVATRCQAPTAFSRSEFSIFPQTSAETLQIGVLISQMPLSGSAKNRMCMTDPLRYDGLSKPF